MGLYKPDSLKVGGMVLPIVDDSLKVDVEGFEKEASLGAGGRDETTHKRKERTITAGVQVGGATGLTPKDLWVCDEQIVSEQTFRCPSEKAKRVRCYPCDTKSVGQIENGVVEVVYLVKAEPEYLL